MATRFNSVAQQSLAAVSSNRDDAKENNNPHLERLLKQLRPFQREAYDYATKGIVSSRQFHVPKHVESKKYKLSTQIWNSSQYLVHSTAPFLHNVRALLKRQLVMAPILDIF